MHEYGACRCASSSSLRSALLTDHLPHGDGLVAFGFIRELAARGHELHVAAERRRPERAAPENVHLHALGASRAPGRWTGSAFMRRLRRLYRRSGRGASPSTSSTSSTRSTSGSASRSPVRRAPLVLGPYVPDWPRLSQARRGRCARPASLRVERVDPRGPAAARHHRAAVDAGRGLEARRAATRDCTCTSCRPASTTGLGPAAAARARPGRPVPRQPRGRARASTCCSTPSPRLARALPDARLRDRRRRARARARSASASPRRPRLERVELLGRVERAERVRWRDAGLRRLLPALATASRSG